MEAKRFGFPLVVLATFAIGFLGVWFIASGGNDVAATLARIDCDTAGADCRERMRAFARSRHEAGDDAGGLAVYRRLALDGDAASAFHIGWYHDEAYRKAVGRSLAATTPIEEDGPLVVERLPGGSTFEAMVDRHAAPQTEDQRRHAARSLAFLWYARAAHAGFGPAMNNLAAMYGAGIVGRIDRREARRWYLAAYDRAVPLAAFTLNRMAGVGYDDPAIDCLEREGTWLPLLLVPPIDYARPEVIVQTRFAGIAPDRRQVELARDEIRRIQVSLPSDQARARAVVETLDATAGRLKYYDALGRPPFDDQTPEVLVRPPRSADDVRREMAARAEKRGDCRGIDVEPRRMRALAEITRRALGEDASPRRRR